MYFTVRRLQPPGNNILVGFIIGRAMAGCLVAASAAVSVRPDGIKTQSSVTSVEVTQHSFNPTFRGFRKFRVLWKHHICTFIHTCIIMETLAE